MCRRRILRLLFFFFLRHPLWASADGWRLLTQFWASIKYVPYDGPMLYYTGRRLQTCHRFLFFNLLPSRFGKLLPAFPVAFKKLSRRFDYCVSPPPPHPLTSPSSLSFFSFSFHRFFVYSASGLSSSFFIFLFYFHRFLFILFFLKAVAWMCCRGVNLWWHFSRLDPWPASF